MQAIHQVITLGDLKMIHILVDEMHADIDSKMHNQLSTMHCAAQTYAGAVSIIALNEKFKINVN